jgi:N-acetylglutamate synthase
MRVVIAGSSEREIELRRMKSSDVVRTLELWRTCEGVGLGEGDSSAELSTFLERNPNSSWVATLAEGDLIGAVLAGHDGRRGFLYHLAVLADYRRQGVASALVEHALSSLRGLGICKYHVMVFRNNQAAQVFWDRMGWRLREDIDVHTFTRD